MTVLWFILGIALIFGIARYNESNKLFWTLLLAFVMGFAVTKMVASNYHSDEQSNENLTQVCPTCVPAAMFNMAAYCITNELLNGNNVVTAQKHMSQGFTPALSETDITLSEVFGRTRDQPLQTLIKPPELCLQKGFLILHDTG